MAGPNSAVETKSRDPYDLDPYRQKIQQLYMKEDRPLNQVMKILKREGCKASRNMYLKKIRSWKMEKNFNYHATIRLLERIHRTQKTTGSRFFQIGDRKITATELLEYFKNQGDEHSTDMVIHFDLRTNSPDSHTAVPSLTPAEPLNSTEKFFQSIMGVQNCVLHNNNIESSHQDARYRNITNAQPTSKALNALFMMSDNFTQGARLMLRGNSKLGGARLEHAFEAIQVALRQSDQHMIIIFLFIVQNMYHKDLPGLAEMFANHLYQMSLVIHGKTHPVTCFGSRLLHHRDMLEELRIGVTVLQDTLEKACGKYHKITMAARATDIIALKAARGDSFKDEIVSKYENLIKDSESLGRVGYTMHVRGGYASYLATHGEFSRGIVILHDIVSMAHVSKDSMEVRAAINSAVSYVELIMDQPQLQGFEESEEEAKRRCTQVENIMTDVIEASISNFGPEDVSTLTLTGWLAEFYLSKGATQKAKFQEKYVNEHLKTEPK